MRQLIYTENDLMRDLFDSQSNFYRLSKKWCGFFKNDRIL